MLDTVLLGRVLFAIGIVGLGALGLYYGDFVQNMEPVPDDFPGRAVLVYVSPLLLVLSGAALAIPRFARYAAMVLAVWLLLWVVVLHAPRITMLSFGPLLTPAETAAMFAGALALVGLLNPAGSHLPQLARYVLGVCCVLFGAFHIAYAPINASYIPSYIPMPLEMAYFTGAAHIAGGLALLTGVLARLGGTLLGVMYGSFFFLVHIPRILADPSRGEFTSGFVNLALTGTAFIIAGYLYRRRLQSDAD